MSGRESQTLEKAGRRLILSWCGGILAAGLLLPIIGGADWLSVSIAGLAIAINVVMWSLLGLAWRASRRFEARLREYHPPTIQLARNDSLSWRNEAVVGEMVDPLLARGFQEAGCFEVGGLPGMTVVGLVHPGESVWGSVVGHDSLKRPILRLMMEAEDGSLFGCSDSLAVVGLPTRPGHSRLDLPGVGAEKLFHKLLQAAPPGPRRPFRVEDFPAAFEKNHADHHDWLIARGGYSSEEIRANLQATGKRSGEAIVNFHRNQWEKFTGPRRRGSLLRLIATRVGKDPAEFSRLTDRLAIVHSSMTIDEAVSVFNAAYRGLAVVRGNPTPWTEPRAVFAHLNEGVPEPRRWGRLGGITDPIVADAYLSPSPIPVRNSTLDTL